MACYVWDPEDIAQAMAELCAYYNIRIVVCEFEPRRWWEFWK